MVQLAAYLVADSVESYRTDAIDGDSVEAIFDPPELEEGQAYRQSIAPDLAALLQGWAVGFCPLNSIERSLSDLIDARGHSVERTAAAVSAEEALSMLEPGDILIVEIVRIPLDLYRARNATNRRWLAAGPSDYPLARSPVFLAGDSAIGSPYFQSISLGFENATFLARLIAQRETAVRDMLDRYDSLDDPLALLEKLHIY